MNYQTQLFATEQLPVNSDDCYTPKWLFDDMAVTFDLDVCAPEGGLPWIPAQRHYSLKDDGLTQPWEGFVWMNPPYSKVTPWWNKFRDHGNGIALIQIAKSNWFQDVWNSDAYLGMPRRTIQPKFIKNGQEHSIFMPVVLIGFGDQARQAIQRAARLR
jgi:hypothetical protein